MFFANYFYAACYFCKQPLKDHRGQCCEKYQLYIVALNSGVGKFRFLQLLFQLYIFSSQCVQILSQVDIVLLKLTVSQVQIIILSPWNWDILFSLNIEKELLACAATNADKFTIKGQSHILEDTLLISGGDFPLHLIQPGASVHIYIQLEQCACQTHTHTHTLVFMLDGDQRSEHHLRGPPFLKVLQV